MKENTLILLPHYGHEWCRIYVLTMLIMLMMAKFLGKKLR